MGYPTENGGFASRADFGPQALLGSQTPLTSGLVFVPTIREAVAFTPPLDRRHSTHTQYPFIFPDHDPIMDSIREKDLRIAWNIAERAANGLRKIRRSKYGEYAKRAENNPFLPQHNHEHGRRVEAHMEALLGNIPEIRRISLPTYLINATALFPYLHDSDQLDTEQHNADTKDSLPPKHAHGAAAALKILAQTGDYAKAAGISPAEARKITGAAAFMMIKHEEPALLMQALAGRDDFSGEKDGTALLDAFENNRLDLTKLRVDQLVKIVIAKKAEKGFTDTTQYGLHPLFESAYADELQALAKNPDSAPLIPNFNEADRDGLELLTQVSVFADVFDMIMPAQEAIARKLGVEKSLRRRFFPPGITFNDLLPDITGDIGNFPDKSNSDITRALWEFEHPLAINDSGIIAQSEYVQDLIGRTVIKGALAYKDVGIALMQGDFSVLAKIFDKRIALVREKLIRKGVDARNNGRIDALYLDRDALLAKLYPKFFTDSKLVYTDTDVAQFAGIMDSMISRLQQRYGVTDEQIEQFKTELEEGSLADMPYKAYDSVSDDVDSLTGPKTIFSST